MYNPVNFAQKSGAVLEPSIIHQNHLFDQRSVQEPSCHVEPSQPSEPCSFEVLSNNTCVPGGKIDLNYSQALCHLS